MGRNIEFIIRILLKNGKIVMKFLSGVLYPEFLPRWLYLCSLFLLNKHAYLFLLFEKLIC
jgi:hypothetical protein